MRLCASCGAQSSFGSCPFCGKDTAPLPTPRAVSALGRPVATRTAAPAPHPPPPARSGPLKFVVGGVVAGVLTILGVAFLSGALGGADDPESGAHPGPALSPVQSPQPEETTAAAAAPVTPSPEPTLSEEERREAALRTLEEMVVRDRGLDPVRGQWVAQLASKYEGVVDLSQQSDPFTIPDILDEVMAARNNPDYGHLVRVIHQGDWGRSEPGPATMWVTVADLDGSSREEIVRWCESRFTQRGEALLNVCYPRELHRR